MNMRDKLKRTVGMETKPVTKEEIEEIKNNHIPQSGPGRMFYTQQKLTEKLEELDRVKEDFKKQRVDIASIVEIPGRKRYLSEERFLELKENIAQIGVVQKIVVRTIEGGKYELIAGHNRLEALRQLGHTEVDVAFKEDEGVRVIESAFYSNLFQSELTAFEKYLGFKGIKDITGETQEELAQKAKVSQQQVSSLFSYDKFPDSAKELLKNNPGILGYDAAAKLISLKESELLDILNKLSLGEITEKKAVTLASPKANQRPARPQPVVIRSGKKTFAEVQRKDNLLVITLKDGSRTEEILEKITALLESSIQ